MIRWGWSYTSKLSISPCIVPRQIFSEDLRAKNLGLIGLIGQVQCCEFLNSSWFLDCITHLSHPYPTNGLWFWIPPSVKTLLRYLGSRADNEGPIYIFFFTISGTSEPCMSFQDGRWSLHQSWKHMDSTPWQNRNNAVKDWINLSSPLTNSLFKLDLVYTLISSS